MNSEKIKIKNSKILKFFTLGDGGGISSLFSSDLFFSKIDVKDGICPNG